MFRNRNWIVASVLIAAVVAAAAIDSRSKPAGTAQTPRVQFGPEVRQEPSVMLLNYTNGWVARAGTDDVGVYAGSQAKDHGNGLLVTVRTVAGRRSSHSVVLRGTGAVTLLKPARPATEADALQATLRFVTASGATGTLDLGDGIASLAH